MSVGGASLPDVSKRAVLLRVPSDIAVLVERLFGKPGDGNEKASYVRAMEEATEDTHLSKADLEAVAREMAKNRNANIRRKLEYAKKHGTRTSVHATDIG